MRPERENPSGERWPEGFSDRGTVGAHRADPQALVGAARPTLPVPTPSFNLSRLARRVNPPGVSPVTRNGAQLGERERASCGCEALEQTRGSRTAIRSLVCQGGGCPADPGPHSRDDRPAMRDGRHRRRFLQHTRREHCSACRRSNLSAMSRWEEKSPGLLYRQSLER